jgi:hypothetical protein
MIIKEPVQHLPHGGEITPSHIGQYVGAASQKTRPIRHQPVPLLEQIGAAIGSFHLFPIAWASEISTTSRG